MKRTILPLLLVFAAAGFAGVRAYAAENANRLPDAARLDILAAAEAAAQKPHPRLFADAAGFAALKECIATDEYAKMGADCLKARADGFLDAPPRERTFTGRRILRVSRDVLDRVPTLALAYRLFGERAHLERAVAELRAVCAFENWNPDHFLDVAEMSMAVATGYDWLYDDLDAATRQEIASALRRHAIDASREPRWWIKTGNNWNQVCHAGILAAALALAEEDSAETARFVQRAVACLPIAMAAFAPNGNFPEGPGYWDYATEYNVLALKLLEGTLGSDFGLASLPGFRETAHYPDLVTGPSGRTFNYADGGDGRGSNPCLWWFARRFECPEVLAYHELAAYRKACEKRRVARTFAYGLLDVRTPPADLKADLPRAWNGEGPVPIATLRSGWDDETALFVGLKGGSPKSNHGHMDIGSFVLDTKGVRWAVDLGAEDYTKIEQRGMSLWSMRQDSDRWTIYRLNATSHNVLTLDGCPQRVEGFGKVVEAREVEDGAALRATLDLTSVYTNATAVARRGTLAADGSQFELRDVVRGLRPGAPIRWAMMTRARVEVDPDGAILLRDKGQTLRLEQTGALTGAWTVAPAKGPNEWDSANKGALQIAFTVAMPSEGDAQLAVTFTRP